MNILSKYNNGNTSVTIYEDGTKVREYEGQPIISFPESIDVKLTDQCNLNCPYCHESSTIVGKHGDLNKLIDVLDCLPAGVEMAYGGGNPLSHPGIVDFLIKMKSKGIISNITVNQGHLKEYESLLTFLIKDDLVKGVGISVTSNNFEYLSKISKLSSNIVYHVIAGINNVSIIDKINEIGPSKFLVLGYKQFGFGINHHSIEIEKNILKFRTALPKYIGTTTISFDNLAIEQLNVRRLFTKEGWERFYMGDDFTFTMYIDAVKQEYAPTSRSNERVSFDKITLIEYFNKNKYVR